MPNLRRRLRKLEAHLLDSSGLVPESPEWIAYWMRKIEKLGTADDTGELIPFAAARYHLMNGPDFTLDRTDRGL